MSVVFALSRSLALLQKKIEEEKKEESERKKSERGNAPQSIRFASLSQAASLYDLLGSMQRAVQWLGIRSILRTISLSY